MYHWTQSVTYDKLLFVFYILRIIFLLPVFLLNLVQLIYEIISIIKKEKLITPRTLSFASCTGYPLFRALSLIVLLDDGNLEFGSLYWHFNVWGTYFIFCLWIFIASYWIKLLFSFFLTNSIILKNQKRVWVASWVFALLILIFNIISVTIAEFDEEMAIRFYSKVFLAIAVLIGTSVGLSGFLLARFMKKQTNRLPQLQFTIDKTIKLASVLILLFMFLIIREIVFAVLKLPADSDYRYIGTFVSSLLEYVMVLTVMVALGGEHLLNYLLFKRVGDKSPNNSNRENSHKSQSHSSKEKQESFNSQTLNGASAGFQEINLTSDFNISSSTTINNSGNIPPPTSAQILANTVNTSTQSVDIEMNLLNSTERQGDQINISEN
ncbi:hypothetical protein DLAC_02537 [Tieghemostelium lacteum]|uniref:THH1/TOM1/TOM3 domain-containing protein n=1 Tax=Tieghemostelium lacteum TaxID=361077 RepID=A0A152A2R9_TIELA|nr:hypothetical protein DLAC_02537 [Tieghemostelium lacteum]|eukprot:KYR00526.1 hypothetical protein DLAC_02537 [Tieghemostelium lacteum]